MHHQYIRFFCMNVGIDFRWNERVVLRIWKVKLRFFYLCIYCNVVSGMSSKQGQ